jgi:hypothetical protein
MNKKKYISPEIFKYLTPLALTVWFKDDGGKYNKNQVVLNTNNYSLRDIKILERV